MMRIVPRGQRQATILLVPITLLATGLSLYPIGQSIYVGFTNYRIGGTFGNVPLRWLGTGIGQTRMVIGAAVGQGGETCSASCAAFACGTQRIGYVVPSFTKSGSGE
jgi:ABC-type sugar transport system permease subunit